MNQRMIELYKEAAEFAYKICKDEGREGGTSDHIWNTLSTEKFAELIVEECLEACSRTNEIRYFVPPGQQQVVLDCMREIEKTFRS